MPNPSRTPVVEPLSEEALAEIEAALLLHVEGKAMVRVDHARALCQSLRAACARYDAEEKDHRLTIDTFRQQERIWQQRFDEQEAESAALREQLAQIKKELAITKQHRDDLTEELRRQP